jgi:hypothetical protein
VGWGSKRMNREERLVLMLFGALVLCVTVLKVIGH